ncbi:STAGA complex 65 subunit gamma-like [Spodoptera frugiperda]|uniref:STAGA complex 65 subunit gamma-like n=1 Tax=Spodoptera frugiperda TaxID=7108 RepID=A0A9R0CZK4_SPOFR|nr:STAGA complex 65 subunit gamma-like [Spodoptera frugiperda]
MNARKLWGEMEDERTDETLLQNVNFNPIIELGMQNIPEISITVKSSPIELPKPNLITHTIQLHAHARQLTNILEQAENALFEGARIGPITLPIEPPEPELKLEHDTNPPINFLEKEYCDFSLGKGPMILPFTPESHKRALRQCAAIALGHVGVATTTNVVLTAVADALDIHMTNMCKLLRTVVDKEASGLKSGFPDAISKVFSDLNVGNLHEFYQNRVVRYHAMTKKKCEDLRLQCEALAIRDIAPQLKLEEVPELHFPAALDGAFTPSLEPGFQMLHSLEQEGLELLEAVTSDDITKMDAMEFSQPETTAKLPTLSPSAKKKRK